MKDIYLRLHDVGMTFEGQIGTDDGLKAWLTRRFLKSTRLPRTEREVLARRQEP